MSASSWVFKLMSIALLPNPRTCVHLYIYSLVNLFKDGGLHLLNKSGVVDNTCALIDIYSNYAPSTLTQCNLNIYCCSNQTREARQKHNLKVLLM